MTALELIASQIKPAIVNNFESEQLEEITLEGVLLFAATLQQ